MFYKINVGVSNRHVHLTKETYKALFDEEITKKSDLNQIGEFSSNSFVTISNNGKKIENVRVVGPFRKYNQIEISKTDARKLGLNPPVRRSGDLSGSEDIVISTDKNEIKLKEAVIIANRHVHVNSADKEKYGVEDNQKVKLHVLGEKKTTLEAFIKISDNGYFEAHLDTDDANSCLINNGDEVYIEI